MTNTIPRPAQPLQPRLTVCVINYNGRALLPQTLAALTALHETAALLLVDNGSTDDSVAWVERNHPTVKVINLGFNAGISVARNAAFAAAQTERLLFIDNDVAVAPDAPTRLHEALDAYPQAVAAMPRVLYADAPKTVQYDGAGLHYLGLMTLDHADWPHDAAPSYIRFIDAVVGACFMFDRARWLNHPGHQRAYYQPTAQFCDPAMFLYLDDLDIGLHLRQRGYQILAVPSAQVLHGPGTADLSLRRTQRYAPLRIENLIANRRRLILKRYTLRTLCLLAPILLLYEVMQLAGIVKKGWLRHWWRATTALWQQRQDLVQWRRAIQQQRRLADRALLQGGPLPFTPWLAQSRLERMGLALFNRLVTLYWRLVQPWL